MKKISLFAMAAAALVGAAAFTGCVQSYPDDEAIVDLSQFYLVGCTSIGWDFDDANQFKVNDDGNYEVTWTATENTAFAISDNSWTTQYRTVVGETTPIVVTVGDEDVLIDSGNPGYGNNASLVGLTTGSDYTMTITVQGAYVKVLSIVCEDGGATFTSYADTSSLTVTTAAQTNAAIVIMGDSTVSGSTTGKKMYFKEVTAGEEYKASMVFTVASAADLAGWGGTYYASWFKFEAGDNSEIGYSITQLKATTTTLGVAGNIGLGDGYDNFEVTDLTAAGVYEFVIDVTADGPTYTISKIGTLD